MAVCPYQAGVTSVAAPVLMISVFGLGADLVSTVHGKGSTSSVR